MKTTINLDDTLSAVIEAEREAYNARPGIADDEPALDTDAFLSALLAQHFEPLRAKYDIENVPMSPELEKAILADPQAVKLAIEARKAKEAAVIAEAATP